MKQERWNALWIKLAIGVDGDGMGEAGANRRREPAAQRICFPLISFVRDEYKPTVVVDRRCTLRQPCAGAVGRSIIDNDHRKVQRITSSADIGQRPEVVVGWQKDRRPETIIVLQLWLYLHQLVVDPLRGLPSSALLLIIAIVDLISCHNSGDSEARELCGSSTTPILRLKYVWSRAPTEAWDRE